MNDLEKRSFYSFLGLYLVSSFFFILLAGFWYYTAQKNVLENNEHYRLEHIADRAGTEIIMAHMHARPHTLPRFPSDIHIALIGIDGSSTGDSLPVPVMYERPDYFERDGYLVLISDAPKDHLAIRYVVVESNALFGVLRQLRQTVLAIMTATALLIAVTAWTLSKLFMRPLHQKIIQTERFVNDISHELNTPVSALTMITEQVLKKKECNEKTLHNIAASTRQLYEIYRSLTYLNFSKKTSDPDPINVEDVLLKSLEYYRPLIERKRLRVHVETEACIYAIPESEALLLFGNLISNAIKYSPAGSMFSLEFASCRFSIRDEGIGIAPDQMKSIFERFKRGTEYAGGFGVGLSIVKRICDDYDIGINVASDTGKGTCFTLRF